MLLNQVSLEGSNKNGITSGEYKQRVMFQTHQSKESERHDMPQQHTAGKSKEDTEENML
jgi:hypothetical protein